jgi:hypothetical protein
VLLPRVCRPPAKPATARVTSSTRTRFRCFHAAQGRAAHSYGFPNRVCFCCFLHAWTSGPFLRLVLPVARQHKKKHLSSHRVNQGFGSGSGDLLPRSHLFLLLFYYMANTPKYCFIVKIKTIRLAF